MISLLNPKGGRLKCASSMNDTQMQIFNSALESLPQFIDEMDADWCMVYDFMEAQVGSLTDAQWDEVEAVYAPFNNDNRY